MEGFAEVTWERRPCYINPRDEMRHLPAACPSPWGCLRVTVPRERAGAADGASLLFQGLAPAAYPCALLHHRRLHRVWEELPELEA